MSLGGITSCDELSIEILYKNQYCKHMHACRHARTHARTHTHTHIHTHTHTHTQMADTMYEYTLYTGILLSSME